MIESERILAVVPARGGSKGLPRKNIRLLGGKPLVCWPIVAALSSTYVDRVVVSTDDPEIASIARAAGASVPFLRPAELANDTASTFSVLQHVLTYLDDRENQRYDYLVLLEPTSPLTEPADIDAALKSLVSQRHIADSIVGVSEVVNSHPDFDVVITPAGVIRPYLLVGNKSPGRRQDISKLYFFEGTVFISDVGALLRNKGFYHDRTLPYIVPKWKSFEVDDPIDFLCIEAMLKHRDSLKESEGLSCLPPVA